MDIKFSPSKFYYWLIVFASTALLSSIFVARSCDNVAWFKHCLCTDVYILYRFRWSIPHLVRQRVDCDTASMTRMSVRVCLCGIHGVRMSAFMLHLSVVSSPSCCANINNYGTHHRQRSKIIEPHCRDSGTWSQMFRTRFHTGIVCAINCDSRHVRGWMSWYFFSAFISPLKQCMHSPRVSFFGNTT